MPDWDEAKQEMIAEVADEYIQQGGDEMLDKIIKIIDEEIKEAKIRMKTSHSIATSKEYAFEGHKIETLTRLKNRIETYQRYRTGVRAYENAGQDNHVSLKFKAQ